MIRSRSNTVRVVKIAELLGVCKQRPHQLAGNRDFRSGPVAEQEDANKSICLPSDKVPPHSALQCRETALETGFMPIVLSPKLTRFAQRSRC